MAVYDILPSTNLRAVDIRDTLLANGANWSTSPIKNANYLPNYFRKEANINMWSRYKPVVYNSVDDITDEDLESVNWGIDIPIYENRDYLYRDVVDGTLYMSYNNPSYNLRLGDFRGYNAKAKPPVSIGNITEVTTNRPFVFEPLISDGDPYNVGFNEIYGDDFRFLLARFELDGEVVWSCSPVASFYNPNIVNQNGIGTIFLCMTNRYVNVRDSPLPTDRYMPFPNIYDNPKEVRYTSAVVPPRVYDIYIREDYPSEFDVTFNINIHVNYNSVPTTYLSILDSNDEIVDQVEFPERFPPQQSDYQESAVLYNPNRIAEYWRLVSGDITKSGILKKNHE